MMPFFHRPEPVCPACGGDLIVLEWAGVEMDLCVDCGGLWLDDGELELIAEMAGVDAGGLTDALNRGEVGAQGQGRCPRCARKLRKMVVREEGEALELDACPKGDGFWFDRGEMRCFVSLFEKGEAGAVAQFFAEMLHDDLA